jgi:hypothetical protein
MMFNTTTMVLYTPPLDIKAIAVTEARNVIQNIRIAIESLNKSLKEMDLSGSASEDASRVYTKIEKIVEMKSVVKVQCLEFQQAIKGFKEILTSEIADVNEAVDAFKRQYAPYRPYDMHLARYQPIEFSSSHSCRSW